LEINSFLRLFLLNETTHFVKKTASFHSFFIEKKTANDVVLMALFVIFFHWTRKGKGRTHTPLMASIETKKQRGQALWMALGKLPNGRPTTLPIQHDWTVVGWLSPPINTPLSGSREYGSRGEWV
jgi:hypothetical protein